MYKRSLTSVAVTALLAPIALFAQDDDRIDEVVVTASPLQQAEDQLTQPVMVLGDAELLTKAAASIGETLANEAGVSSTYFGPVTGRPVIRGQSGPRISVLESGVSSLDVADLSPDHAVPVEPLFAERVEVIRGPGVLAYGSSAAGGIVNVVDGRIPRSLPEQAISAALEARADTVANQQVLAGRVDGMVGQFAWHVDAFDRSSDDVDIPDFATADPAERDPEEPRGVVRNSFGESDGVAAGFSWVTDNGYLGVSQSAFNNTYGLPKAEEEEAEEEGPEIFDGPFIDLEQQRTDLRAEYSLAGPIERVRVQAGFNDYEHSEIEPSGEVGTRFDNEAWEARIELTHALLAERWRGAFGVQLGDRDFSAAGEEAYLPAIESSQTGLFIVEELATDFGFIEFGARYENLEHDPAGGLPAYDENGVSLALGARWQITGDRDLAVNVSRSERLADVGALYSDGAHLATGLFEVGLLARGVTVEDEVATNIDLALHHHHEGIDWRVSVFLNDIDDYTFRDITGAVEDGLPVANYVQQDARFYGFEAELELTPEAGASPWTFGLLADNVRGKTDDDDLPRIQPPRLGVSVDYTQPDWSAGLSALYHAEQDKISSFQTDSFVMLDAEAIRQWQIGERSTLDLFVKLTNLLDEDARRSTSFLAANVPLPGRSAMLGARLKLR